MNKPYQLHLGDCIEVLKTMADNSVDSIVTDPPYELGFMGKKWDNTGIAYNVEMWKEVLRVLKPGGHLLSFSGSRTYHRMTCAIEDAGFEIRDQIMWIYGSGFPKSQNISKAIDKAAGAEREVIGVRKHPTLKDTKKINRDGASSFHGDNKIKDEWDITVPHTDEAKQWDGWGTALKPAHEPVCMARKPLSEKTIVANVLKHGTGGINIDGCRIDHVTVDGGNLALNPHLRKTINGGNGGNIISHEIDRRVVVPNNLGRYPANIIHDGSNEVVELFPNNNKGCKPHIINASEETEANNKEKGWGSVSVPKNKFAGFDDGDNVSAARFFYSAKTSKKDRNEGCEHLDNKFYAYGNQATAEMKKGNVEFSSDTNTNIAVRASKNNHPTVKPTELMKYLIRLVTPPNGTVLDPFMGSGSTGKAAMAEGFNFIGIDMTPEYVKIAESRIASEYEKNHIKKEPLVDLFEFC